VVQARTGSSRLPGKVLAEVGGLPLLELMLRRLAPLAVDRVVVATTTAPSDDAVAVLAHDAGAAVIRGDEQDVLARFAAALREHPADVVVRLTADCPFVDPELVATGLREQERDDADHVSNVLVRTHPDGLDFEVVRAEALLAAAREAVAAAEREHVTPFLFRRPERFRLRAVREEVSLGHLRWTVDTAEDLQFVRSIANRLADPTSAGWREICEVAVQPTPGVWLRPAAVEDAFLPEGTPMDDPGRRVWVAVDASGSLAWSRVDVRTGRGLWTGGWAPGRAEDETAADAVAALFLAAMWPQCMVVQAGDVPNPWRVAAARKIAVTNAIAGIELEG